MNTLKKMSAFVLAFMLIFSMCMVSVSAAETEASTATVLYVKPGSNWVQSNPRYAMYLFNSKENTWVDMTDEDGDGYYEAEVPAGDWTSVIFCRMNPAKKDNNWNNKWNQTSDLAIPTDSNCYLVKDGTWDKGGGEWVTYVPGEEPSTAETEPTEAPSYKYTVAGDAGLCGVAWTPASEKNALTDEDGDGVYEITYKDVPAGTYSFKVTDGTWNNSWGVGTGNYSINLNDTADVTIKFTEATKKIEVECSALGDFVLKHMTVVGDEGLVGAKWDPKAEEGVMTETEDGIWSITFKNVAAGEYEYKFLANDNYTYNWTVEGYFNNSENSIIKVDNDGADVTLTIDVSAYDFSAKKGSVKATAAVAGGTVDPTASTDPTEPTESQPVTVPADQDFYLFGTINGENYGCEEDWESLGDYKFVDGKLSVTFDTVSYVAVKTGDNKGWYMTDGWAGITKSVTLYSTSVLGEDANKLIVPAGKVDFTLTANDDGTLTLSYESENEPEIPTEPATDPTAETDPTESTAAPATKDYYLFGTINGANYGCEDDWKTIGDYKFVDGKLSTTFDTVSYVAVKTGDNAGWYMTDGWQGITKSVTLYSTSKLGEDANKLIVPAGKVDFTLVENADGTLTLSYESENEPEIPTEEPTTEEPTTAEPTTAPATQPTTSAPSDVPSDGYYVYGDNIKLKLTTIGTDKVGGTIALQKGTYTFKLDNYGTLLGYGKSFTDTTKGLTFNKKFGSSATLNATGGTYTFQVSTKTNTLVVKYSEKLPNEYLIGDLNTILSPVDGKPIAVGSTYLAEGTYKFKLSAGAVAYGYNKVINDTTNGASLTLNSKYSSYLTLNATGGTYTFTLNTTTKRLVVGYVPAKDEKTDDVHVSGDINLVLDDNGGESDIATGTVKLEEGTYSFKIFNYGVGFTAGSKIVDSGTKALKSSYKSNVTLIASGGTYEFSFNKTTGALTVTQK